jgi:hypothetical protein
VAYSALLVGMLMATGSSSCRDSLAADHAAQVMLAVRSKGELIVYEAFLAMFSAAVFWVFICPLIVWLLAAIYLKCSARHTPRASDA